MRSLWICLLCSSVARPHRATLAATHRDSGRLPAVTRAGAIQSLIREVIAAHPLDYDPAGDLQANTVHALQKLVPPAQRGMLDQLFVPRSQGEGNRLMMGNTAAADRQLGSYSESLKYSFASVLGDSDLVLC